MRVLEAAFDAELRELWRRMVFSLLVSNCDDHLRNHGFLMHTPGRWSLSPAYDVNPVPEVDRGHGQQTPPSEGSTDFSIAHALAIVEFFRLSPARAKAILRKVATAIARWQQVGKRLRLPAATLASYASAFANPCRDEAKRLSRLMRVNVGVLDDSFSTGAIALPIVGCRNSKLRAQVKQAAVRTTRTRPPHDPALAASGQPASSQPLNPGITPGMPATSQTAAAVSTMRRVPHDGQNPRCPSTTCFTVSSSNSRLCFRRDLPMGTSSF